MTAFWHVEQGRRCTYTQLRREHPQVSFPREDPADLSHLGYLPIDPVEPPAAPTPQDEVIEGPPEASEPGRMRQTWIIRPRPEPLPPDWDRAMAPLVDNLSLSWSS